MPRCNTRTEAQAKQKSPRTSLGALIARLRNKNKFSRRKFVFILHDVMAHEDFDSQRISESWLARLENGYAVKQLPTATLTAISKALRCTGKEHTDLMLYADRNVLTQDDKRLTHGAEVLNYVTHYIHQEAYELLADIDRKDRTKEFNQLEMLEIVHDILSILIERHRA